MRLSLFDLHCDTAYRMQSEHQGLLDNSFSVSLRQAEAFDHYYQIMALWISDRLEDEEGWNAMLQMLSNLQKDRSVQEKRALLCSACPPVSETRAPVLMLSLEDARILGGHVERVDRLFDLGIRIITPLWRGCSCIGGAHDTSLGLTEFGKQAIRRALSRGMILDISHASHRSAEEILDLGKSLERPVIASHSNAYAICPVSRNLCDTHIKRIIESDGIIGINLHRYFLRADGNATLDDILLHIDYLLEKGAEKALCIGADMDGGEMPSQIPSLSHLPILAEELQKRNFSDSLIQSIFFENAYRFARRYINL